MVKEHINLDRITHIKVKDVEKGFLWGAQVIRAKELSPKKFLKKTIKEIKESGDIWQDKFMNKLTREEIENSNWGYIENEEVFVKCRVHLYFGNKVIGVICFEDKSEQDLFVKNATRNWSNHIYVENHKHEF